VLGLFLVALLFTVFVHNIPTHNHYGIFLITFLLELPAFG